MATFLSDKKDELKAFDGDTYIEERKCACKNGLANIVFYVVLAVCALADFYIFENLLAQAMHADAGDPSVIGMSLAAVAGYLTCTTLAGNLLRQSKVSGNRAQRLTALALAALALAVIAVVTIFRFTMEASNAAHAASIAAAQGSLSNSLLGGTGASSANDAASAAGQTAVITIIMCISFGLSATFAYHAKDAKYERVYLEAKSEIPHDRMVYEKALCDAFDNERKHELEAKESAIASEEVALVAEIEKARAALAMIVDPAVAHDISQALEKVHETVGNSCSSVNRPKISVVHNASQTSA